MSAQGAASVAWPFSGSARLGECPVGAPLVMLHACEPTSVGRARGPPLRRLARYVNGCAAADVRYEGRASVVWPLLGSARPGGCLVGAPLVTLDTSARASGRSHAACIAHLGCGSNPIDLRVVLRMISYIAPLLWLESCVFYVCVYRLAFSCGSNRVCFLYVPIVWLSAVAQIVCILRMCL